MEKDTSRIGKAKAKVQAFRTLAVRTKEKEKVTSDTKVVSKETSKETKAKAKVTQVILFHRTKDRKVKAKEKDTRAKAKAQARRTQAPLQMPQVVTECPT